MVNRLQAIFNVSCEVLMEAHAFPLFICIGLDVPSESKGKTAKDILKSIKHTLLLRISLADLPFNLTDLWNESSLAASEGMDQSIEADHVSWSAFTGLDEVICSVPLMMPRFLLWVTGTDSLDVG